MHPDRTTNYGPLSWIHTIDLYALRISRDEVSRPWIHWTGETLHYRFGQFSIEQLHFVIRNATEKAKKLLSILLLFDNVFFATEVPVYHSFVWGVI
jgi:hypothetical protein